MDILRGYIRLEKAGHSLNRTAVHTDYTPAFARIVEFRHNLLVWSPILFLSKMVSYIDRIFAERTLVVDTLAGRSPAVHILAVVLYSSEAESYADTLEAAGTLADHSFGHPDYLEFLAERQIADTEYFAAGTNDIQAAGADILPYDGLDMAAAS
jgi:hypothetical protein